MSNYAIFDLSPDEDSMCLYIRILYGGNKFSDLCDFVQNPSMVDTHVNPEMQIHPQLQELPFVVLRDVHTELGRALRTEQKIALIQPQIAKELAEYEAKEEFTTAPWVAAHIAEFKYSFFDDVTESMRLFEMILSPAFKAQLAADVQWAYTYPRASAIRHLAQIFYEKAEEAHARGESPDAWVEKLRRGATGRNFGSSSSGGNAYLVNSFSLSLGSYLRQYHSTSDWKSCFRTPILEAIRILTDDDPMNDFDAYARLLEVLLMAGDIKNATAAADVVFLPLAVNEEYIPALEKLGFSARRYTCKGMCTTISHEYYTDIKELHFCTVCLGTSFCKDCLKMHKEWNLPFRICSPQHDFIKLFPVPKDAEDVAAYFDGEVFEVEKGWLESLQKEWDT